MTRAAVTETQSYIFGAWDPDCDGPTTALYRAAIPAGLVGDAAHAAAFECVGQNYFDLDETAPVSADEAREMMDGARSVMGDEVPVEWYDHGHFEHVTFKGDGFAPLRERGI